MAFYWSSLIWPPLSLVTHNYWMYSSPRVLQDMDQANDQPNPEVLQKRHLSYDGRATTVYVAAAAVYRTAMRRRSF